MCIYKHDVVTALTGAADHNPNNFPQRRYVSDEGSGPETQRKQKGHGSCFILQEHTKEPPISEIPEPLSPVEEMKRRGVEFMSPAQRSTLRPLRRTAGVSVGPTQLKPGSWSPPWPSLGP